MPIPPVNSEEDIGPCIEFLMNEGKPQDQATAICYDKLEEFERLDGLINDILLLKEAKTRKVSSEGYIDTIKDKDKREYAKNWLDYRKKLKKKNKAKKPVVPKGVTSYEAKMVRSVIDTLGV